MVTMQPLQEFDSFKDMALAASEAAATSFGLMVSGTLYTQGGRRFISTGLPVRMLLKLAQTSSAKKQSDPTAVRNRPLDPAHVREIIRYLSNEDRYLVPPIMLNASQPLQIFIHRTSAATKPCTFVLPPDEYLYVTDGQHRLEALREAIGSRPELANDSVGVTIIEEHDLEKVHQDFYDAAQVKPLSPALLVEYDRREPMNWLAREVSIHSRVLRNRTERIGKTVGKNSLMLFTSNQVKGGVALLVSGSVSVQQAGQAVEAAKDLWHARVLAFFEEFTSANLQWDEVAMSPLEEGKVTSVPDFRSAHVHFTGGGLLVLCGVGHAILASGGLPDGSLSDEQKQSVRKLAEIDWSRRSDLWSGNVIGPDGNVNQGRSNIELAVARAKAAIGLPLTEKDQRAISKADASSTLQDQSEEPALIS